MTSLSSWLARRLPFYYGWVVIAVAFVTMAIGVNSRTAFSLLYPPILDEFGWERGVTAAAFSLGFVASVAVAPFTGVLMDRFGPRFVISLGAVLVSTGLVLATHITTPIGLYLTLGGLVVGSSVFMSYIGHSAFLPHWFVRRRGLAIGIAFSGVGVGSIILFPAVQQLIGSSGWRQACLAMAVLIVVSIVPLNVLLQRTAPRELGLAPDGEPLEGTGSAPDPDRMDNVADPEWAAVEWTVRSALGTVRYWWLFLGLMTALYAWYAVQVHQTRYFIEVGFSDAEAAWALGLVGLTGIAGQIALGHLSDRVGREVGWTIACGGYVLCYALLIVLPAYPSRSLMYAAAAAQGVLGYGVAPIYSAIAAELFQGRHFGAIFGTLSVATTLGAASGPWATGALYDSSGSYALGFAVALGCAALSCAFIWLAAPRKVRLVAGRAEARRRRLLPSGAAAGAPLSAPVAPVPRPSAEVPKVHAVAIRDTPIVLGAGETRALEALALDRGGREVRAPVTFEWSLDGTLAGLGSSIESAEPQDGASGKRVHLRAGPRPGEGRLTITALAPGSRALAVRRVSVTAPGRAVGD